MYVVQEGEGVKYVILKDVFYACIIFGWAIGPLCIIGMPVLCVSVPAPVNKLVSLMWLLWALRRF